MRSEERTADGLGTGRAGKIGDLLLRTKLFVPRLHPSLVPRARLIELLDEGLSRKLTLVSAPAGFGKTTMLSEWSLRSDRPVAWVSLDGQDNDPARFWVHVIGAKMVAIAGETALVFDDYHLIENEDVHRGVRFLLDHLPPRMSMVIAARHDPPLPLAQLRARNELTEVRADNLRLSEEEVAAVLRNVTGAEQTPDALRIVEQRTEGWAAGVQLAGVSPGVEAIPAASSTRSPGRAGTSSTTWSKRWCSTSRTTWSCSCSARRSSSA